MNIELIYNASKYEIQLLVGQVNFKLYYLCIYTNRKLIKWAIPRMKICVFSVTLIFEMNIQVEAEY